MQGQTASQLQASMYVHSSFHFGAIAVPSFLIYVLQTDLQRAIIGVGQALSSKPARGFKVVS